MPINQLSHVSIDDLILATKTPSLSTSKEAQGALSPRKGTAFIPLQLGELSGQIGIIVRPKMPFLVMDFEERRSNVPNTKKVDLSFG
jgi:hypothetical protein